MFGLFDSKAREIRNLNRDAPVIIEDARQSYRSELVRDIAVLTHQRLQEVKANCAGDEACIERAVAHFRRLHREARRRLHHVELTAYTLVIIHLRSQALGGVCRPARGSIDAFLDEWRHAIEEAANGGAE